jgi:hypothetical protein
VTTTLTIEVDGKHQWGAIAGMWGFGDGVFIPVDQVDGMTDEQIGTNYREMLQWVECAKAHFLADYVLHGMTPKREEVEKILEYITRLEKFQDNDELIFRAAAMLRSHLNDRLRRDDCRREVPEKRRQLRNDYDRLFVTIGNRDGFCCKQCGAITDLTIDHIKALIKGGTNDLDNLQLLCRSHNSQKSDKD